MLFRFFKYILLNSSLFQIYLKRSKKINFNGIENFNPIRIDKKPLGTLMKIDDDYFSANLISSIPIKMHSFDWLSDFRVVGGIELLKKSRVLILNWDKCKINLSAHTWQEILVARRMINLSTNFNFYAASADNKFRKKITDMISFHFRFLNSLIKFEKEKFEIDIEITKSILALSKLFKNENYFKEITLLILEQIRYQINANGFHKSINVNEQARFIHQLIEIKNIFLYYKENSPQLIEDTINDMTSLLKNFFHRDNSLALFNGSNNSNFQYVSAVSLMQKDIKTKKLFNIKDGIVVIEAEKSKIFFDITRPNSRQLNRKLHSGTLSFELSNGSDKIITNCGSSEKYVGKNQIFFRYSAAHSTIIINNTNIAELSEKNSYKRIPENLKIFAEEDENWLIVSGSHDGYIKNFSISTKRTLKINKNGKIIKGTDQIFRIKNNKNIINFQIRFHLMPECSSVVTNDNKTIIIKSKNGVAWYFKSLKNQLSLKNSVYMGSGISPIETKQIVVSGSTSSIKENIDWSLDRIN